MLRIRFHGRGGHGTKTASRIVGTAAYLSGFQAQDSPIYGAERRGAPIAAFTRIGEEPIRERGVIEAPDVIVVADESLLTDPLAGVLAGQDAASAIFVNTDSAERVAQLAELKPQLLTYDLTTKTHELLGKTSALSAGLAGAAARLSGLITEDRLAEAVNEELSGLGFSGDILDKNVAIARAVYATVEEVLIEPHAVARVEEMATNPYEDAVTGSPEIQHTGNAVLKITGNWRVEQPVIDLEGCTKCGLCVVLCPDGAIALNKETYPVIDYDHCKGCMICARICPPKVIAVKKEVKAW